MNSCVVRQSGENGPPYGLPRCVHSRHVASGVTVTAVLTIHIWIHVASVVTVAAVLTIHIWIHVASG